MCACGACARICGALCLTPGSHVAAAPADASLPTVLTIFKGRMTDSFVGAQQPKAVAEFVGRAAALAAANPEVEQTAETAVITATEVRPALHRASHVGLDGWQLCVSIRHSRRLKPRRPRLRTGLQHWLPPRPTLCRRSS